MSFLHSFLCTLSPDYGGVAGSAATPVGHTGHAGITRSGPEINILNNSPKVKNNRDLGTKLFIK